MRGKRRFLHPLVDEYIVAEDSGINIKDVPTIGKEIRHVAGDKDRVNMQGKYKMADPLSATAYGTFVNLRTVVKHKLGLSDFDGLKIVIQGIGNVVYYLASYLYEAGADLCVSDIDEEKFTRAKRT